MGTRSGTGCPRYGATKYWYEGFNPKAITNDLHFSWSVAYEPGVLRAEGYNKGELVAVDEIETTGRMASLEAKCYDSEAAVDKLIQIELTAKDAEDRFASDACPMVSCGIKGPAHLIGMDAGDLTDLTIYKSSERKMFHGLLLAAIMPYDKGVVQVTFTTQEGCKAVVELQVG